MNYKSIIKSRDMRLKILQFLSFIPDKQMLQLQYRIKMGRKLNLKDPKRYTEKLQWYKLYYRDPLMSKCADKYDVREYVRVCNLDDILIPDYGVFNSAQEINWDKLPNTFVLKDTLGGGGNSVYLCSDKEKIDFSYINNQLEIWTNADSRVKNGGREWVYEGKKHRIYIEQKLPSDLSDGGLIDYKVFCFNGKAEFLYVAADRDLGNNFSVGFYSRNFERLNVSIKEEQELTREIKKPKNYEKMIHVAEQLSQPFPHARIDLYNIDGQIYFGEITFFCFSGYMTFDPDTFDFELGNAFVLPQSGGGIAQPL